MRSAFGVCLHGSSSQRKCIRSVQQMGNAEPYNTLKDLLETADFVSLHVPTSDTTKGMMDASEIATMKKGAYLSNASRDTVVNLEAVASALKSGHLPCVGHPACPHIAPVVRHPHRHLRPQKTHRPTTLRF